MKRFEMDIEMDVHFEKKNSMALNEKRLIQSYCVLLFE